MGATSPDNIVFPDPGSPGGFRTLMSAMATSIQNALKNRISKGGYRYATTSERDADWPSGSTPTGTRTRVETELFEREWNGTTWVPTGAGLLPIKPSAVVGAGSQLIGGQISWTNATQVRFDDCFPAGFDGYRLILHDTINGSADTLRMWSQLAGAIDTSGNNYFQTLAAVGTAVTGSRANSGLTIGGSFNGPRSAVFDFIPVPSQGIMLFTGQASERQSLEVNLYHYSGVFATLPSGLIINKNTSGSGSHTGRAEIYGYRQNVV